MPRKKHHCRVNAYTGDLRCLSMASAGTLTLMLMSLMDFLGLETTDMSRILEMFFNAIETAIGLLILGILALIYLLGLIPNPFPWALSTFL